MSMTKLVMRVQASIADLVKALRKLPKDEQWEAGRKLYKECPAVACHQDWAQWLLEMEGK